MPALIELTFSFDEINTGYMETFLAISTASGRPT